MTTEERLTAIEAQLAMRMLGEIMPIATTDVRWLIAKLRECNDACEKGKAIIHAMKDQSEYERGRADERREVCLWMSKFKWLVDDVQQIERGEHVEATDAKPTL